MAQGRGRYTDPYYDEYDPSMDPDGLPWTESAPQNAPTPTPAATPSPDFAAPATPAPHTGDPRAAADRGIAGPQVSAPAPFRPSQQQWDNASNAINAYVSKENTGSTINWEKARAEFERQAAAGGNHGDWVNRTMGARTGWLNSPAVPPPTSAPFTSQTRDRIVQGWRDSTMAPTRQGIEQYLASLGPDGQGWRVDRDDKVYDPSGRVYDWIGDVNTPGAQRRTGYTTDARYADVTGSKPGGQSGTPTATPSAAAPPAAAGTNQLGDLVRRSNEGGASVAFQQEIRDMLLSRLKDLQGAGDPNTLPEVTQPMAAARREAERVRRNRQDADAERLTYQEGAGDSGALDSAIGRGYEDMSSDLSVTSADLVSRIMRDRRDELARLLDMAVQTGDAESTRELNRELAAIDAELQREGLGESARQFNRSDRFRYADLREGGRQFDDTYGANRADAITRFLETLMESGMSYTDAIAAVDQRYGTNR